MKSVEFASLVASASYRIDVLAAPRGATKPVAVLIQQKDIYVTTVRLFDQII